MPCDESNLRLIKVRVNGGQSPPIHTDKIVNIWSRIQEGLGQPIKSVDDIVTAMRNYYCNPESLNVLSHTLDQVCLFVIQNTLLTTYNT